MVTKKIYFSGLNGLRSIAVLAVVFSHITLQLNIFGLKNNLFGLTIDGKPKGYLLATYGVSIFFVLSGFLITYLLFIENKMTDSIDIKKFYFRRLLRIWPLYYSYLAICIISLILFAIPFESSNLFFFIFISANFASIFNFSLPFLYHYWSLGVEEQFYLFWPWLVKKAKNNFIFIVVLLIVLQNLIRIYLGYFYLKSYLFNFSIINRFDCMMIGALGAFYYKNNTKWVLKLVDNKISQFISLFILILLIINKFHINAIIDNFIISLVTLILIIGQINIKNRIINLDLAIFNFLGKISFGIYVYHPLIIFLFSKFINQFSIPNNLKYSIVYLSIFFLTISISSISYYHFEMYFIKLKSKYTIVKSSNSKI